MFLCDEDDKNNLMFCICCFEMSLKIIEFCLYLVKSCVGVFLDVCVLMFMGLVFDWLFCVVNVVDGKFIS